MYKFLSSLQQSVIEAKYCLSKNNVKETFDEAILRVAQNVNKYDTAQESEMVKKTIEYISNKDFSPAGGIWRAAGNPVTKISYVNCTTQYPVKDSIEDIWDSIKLWSRIASYGQGNGIDISGLRPRGANTYNCAKTSTGAVSFLSNYDASMQTIGAENRRGATKPDMWGYHPDVQEFISCKQDTKKLTSQNISVKVDDAFMKAVEADSFIEQKWERIGNKVYVGTRFINESEGPELTVSKQTKASEIFTQIAKSAWTTGEPGIEFWSTSENYSNSNYHPNNKYHIVSTNGCSEQKLDPENTCILASLNFYNMPLLEEDWNSWLKERVSFGIRFLDNVVEAEYQEGRSPTKEQRDKLRSMTRIGLGFTGLADWFIKNNIIYGSEESKTVTEKLMQVFTEQAYRTSIELGKERGSFTEFSPEWYKNSTFVKRLCKNTNLKLEDFTHIRHVCCVSVAPTGTLSFVVFTGGTGTENLFAPYLERKERATTGEYVSHFVFDNCVQNECLRLGISLTKENVDTLVKDNKWVFSNNLNSRSKVELMGVISRYIDSGISVTYNLPKNSTVNEVKDIYLKAWKEGLKSVTVYRDGSREGILNYSTTTSNLKIKKTNAPKRPETIPCEIHHLTVKGEKWVVCVGLLNSDPYEIFCGKQESVQLSSKFKSGTIRKVGKSKYNLLIPVEDDNLIFDIKKTFKNEASESSATRLISTSLRHGIDVKFIVEQLEKSEDDMLSFSRAISRVLKKYIPDGTEVSGEVCPACQSNNLVRQAGCVTCVSCGNSKCL